MEFGFDIGTIQSCTQNFRTYRGDMHELQDNLKSAYNALLSSDWRGRASTAMSEIIGEDWCDSVIRYCELMDTLTEIMDDVSATYQDVYNRARELSIEL